MVKNKKMFQVLLKYDYNNETFCLGTLIDKGYIITSARCMHYRTWPGILPNFLVKLISLVNSTIQTIDDVFIHQKFQYRDIINNIALIKVTLNYIKINKNN